jgi:hypothetical protein
MVIRYLLWDHDVELDSSQPHPADEVQTEKATVRPKPPYGSIGQLSKHQREKCPGLMATGGVPGTKNPSQIVPRLSHKAQKGMVALPPPLLGIVTLLGTVLLAKDRDDMRVEIQGNLLQISKALPNTVQRPRIDLGNMKRLVNSDLSKKATDGALHRESLQPNNLLSNLVRCQLHHVAGPENSHHQTIEKTQTDLSSAVVRFSSPILSEPLYTADHSPFAKKATDQPSTSKASQVLSGELLFGALDVAILGLS